MARRPCVNDSRGLSGAANILIDEGNNSNSFFDDNAVPLRRPFHGLRVLNTKPIGKSGKAIEANEACVEHSDITECPENPERTIKR